MVEDIIDKFILRVRDFSEQNSIRRGNPVFNLNDLSLVVEKISKELDFKSNDDFNKVAMALSTSPHMKYRFNDRLIYHSYKVGIIASKLTHTLKLKKPRKYCFLKEKEIRNAGFIHDIGHLISPIETYFKKDKLSKEDRKILSQHTQQGEIILSILGIRNSEIINATMFHHEKMDGSGYYGLMGRQIPLCARIICIADIYDALRSERVYKPGFSEDKTFEIMYNENMFRVYDSEVLDVMRKMSSMFNFFYDSEFQSKLKIFKND